LQAAAAYSKRSESYINENACLLAVLLRPDCLRMFVALYFAYGSHMRSCEQHSNGRGLMNTYAMYFRNTWSNSGQMHSDSVVCIRLLIIPATLLLELVLCHPRYFDQNPNDDRSFGHQAIMLIRRKEWHRYVFDELYHQEIMSAATVANNVLQDIMGWFHYGATLLLKYRLPLRHFGGF
jgi:hypothetical protein